MSAITVGAYDIAESFAAFSNHGPILDLLGPGVGIQSLSLSTAGQLELVTDSGTSLAAPHVSGAASVYLSENPTATPAQILQMLIDNARPIISAAPTSTTNLAGASTWMA